MSKWTPQLTVEQWVKQQAEDSVQVYDENDEPVWKYFELVISKLKALHEAQEKIKRLEAALDKIEAWADKQEIYASVVEIDEDELGMLYHYIHSAKVE